MPRIDRPRVLAIAGGGMSDRVASERSHGSEVRSLPYLHLPLHEPPAGGQANARCKSPMKNAASAKESQFPALSGTG
jgi:hypothetical protein